MLQRAVETSLAAKGVAIGSSRMLAASREPGLGGHSSELRELRSAIPRAKGGPLLVRLASGAGGEAQIGSVEAVDRSLRGLVSSVSEALAEGWGRWQGSAKASGVTINGPVGNLVPGSLRGSGFESRLVLLRLREEAAGLENVARARAAPAVEVKMPGAGAAKGAAVEGARGDAPDRGSKPGDLELFRRHAEAIAESCCSAFDAWARGYSAQLSYPAGAACAATLPPTPNVPLPLGGGRSSGEAGMRAGPLANGMMRAYGRYPKHPELTRAVFESFAEAFAGAFQNWKSATMLTQVVGAGGVAPSPPLPPGPVAGATGNGGSLA
jgi:hypothetical protein